MNIKIGDKIIPVRIAKSAESIEKGMMDKTFTNFGGMFFILKKNYTCFWMKNCIIPLDIIFIDEKFRIIDIFEDCEPCEEDQCEHFCSRGKYVLEVPAGFCRNNEIDLGLKIKLLY